MECLSNGCFVLPPGEYGYLRGKVQNIGADALESTDQQSTDRQRANTFPMTIVLTDNQDKFYFGTPCSWYAGIGQHYRSPTACNNSAD